MRGRGFPADPLLIDEEGRVLGLLGNEAIARGALEAGVAFVAGYPGTPSSEITDGLGRISEERGIVFEYSVNEKIAVEAAFGASLAGARALTAMKHLGLGYAGDPLSTIPYVGTVGGLVIVSAGDPSCQTSPNEQDQRYLGPMLHVVMLDPTDVAEARRMTAAAFEISERSRLPVVLRPTTRVCHTRAPVTLGRLAGPRTGRFVRDPKRYVPVPANARRMRVEIESRLAEAGAALGATDFVKKIGSGPEAIIAAGAAAWTTLDLIRARGLSERVSLLSVGIVHPFPERALLDFLRGHERVLILEELSPFLEDQLRAACQQHRLSVEILGKRTGHVPIPFELGPPAIEDAMRRALGLDPPSSAVEPRAALPPVIPAPIRAPVLCSGCPHRSSYFAARTAFGDQTIYFNDIGCYTLGYGPPLDTADALLSMGASFPMAAGAARVTGKRTVAFMGDSTFFHSGMPALLDAVKEEANLVAVILDNQVTAMTGFQESPTCAPNAGDCKPEARSAAKPREGGRTDSLRPGTVRFERKVSIEGVVRALGVEHVERVDPNDLPGSISAFERARDARGVSVVIMERPCPVALDKITGKDPSRRERAPAVDPARCQTCGRAALGFRCDVPPSRGLERHMAGTAALGSNGTSAQLVEPKGDLAPCTVRCPLFLCIQGYVGHVAGGEYEQALHHITARVPLPESICRVCHHPCESGCVRSEIDQPVAINPLKRFVVEWAAEHRIPYQPKRDPEHGRSVAVVGAGPAGLAAAHDLLLRGYRVTLYDAARAPGGLLRTGIPRFRLPPRALERDVARILELGARLVPNAALGRDFTLDGLLEEHHHDAVVLAIGAHRTPSLGLDGEDRPEAPVVESGLGYLSRVQLEEPVTTGRRVVVIGGGNAAIDVARTAIRCGAEKVTLACVESRAEMPAFGPEIRAAEQEGVEIVCGVRPLSLVRGDRPALVLGGAALSAPDADGRRRIEGLAGPERSIDCDQVLTAIGQIASEGLDGASIRLRAHPDGRVAVDPETAQTSDPRVFAGGDLVDTERSVVGAIAWGQRAAWGVDRSLRGAAVADQRPPPPRPPRDGAVPPAPRVRPGSAPSPRRVEPERPVTERVKDLEEVHSAFSEAEARAEAARCLSCGLCGNCRSCIELFGCPAIVIAPSGQARILRDACIACNVCRDLCPDGAIGGATPWRA